MKTVVTAGSFIQQLFLDSAVSNIMTGKNHWVSNKHHYECQHIYKVAFVQDFWLDEKKKLCTFRSHWEFAESLKSSRAKKHSAIGTTKNSTE